jgi:ATPase family protein associated with various cellular activities (AAA)
MVEPFSTQIMHQLSQVVALYHRLVLVVAPSGAGKTAALREVAAQTNGHYINVNLELSRRLLDLPQRQWPLQAPRLLEDIVQGDREQVILLDNIELLFDVALQLHPLRCLHTLARQRTMVTAWNGTVTNGFLTYAAPGHPEYCRYPLANLLVVSPTTSESTVTRHTHQVSAQGGISSGGF